MRPWLGTLPRRLGLAALLALTLGAWEVAAPASGVAAADRSISYTSAATYTVEPARRRVHVSIRVAATVRAKDTASTRSWFEGLSIAVPASTEAFQAAAGATSLPVSILARHDSDTQLAVGFARRVYADQTFSFVLQFDLVDYGKSPGRDLRLGKTLVSFPVWAYGTPATPGSSVTVVFPPDYVIYQEVGGLVPDAAAPGAPVAYRSGPLADVTQFYAWFSAQTSPSYAEVAIKVGPLDVTLRHWADDPDWAPAIAGLLAKAYPQLRDLIGVGDVPAGPLTIIESPIHESAGYRGLFEPQSGTMAVSYSADAFVLLHELAHLWFNGDLVANRWAAEGFASYYAGLAAERLKILALGPELSASMLAAAIPLDLWNPRGTPTALQDQYAYGASAIAARQIAAIAGPAGLSAVWARAKAGWSAYQPPDAAEPVVRAGAPPDSRSLLDMLEQETGGSYDSVWQQWVLPAEQAPLLERRAAARQTYRALLDEAKGWRLPDALRASLAAWDFSGFTVGVAEARAVFANRETIDSGAAREGTSPPATLRQVFEGDGTAAAFREANAELQALDALAAARSAQNDVSGTTGAVGLFGADPERSLAAARQAFAAGRLQESIESANEARGVWEGARDAGRNRLLLAGAAGLWVALLAVAAALARRRRTRGGTTAGATDLAAAQPAGDLAAVPARDPVPQAAIAAVAGADYVEELGEAVAPDGNGHRELLPEPAAPAGVPSSVPSAVPAPPPAERG